jgi:putative transcriptional regulator
MSRNPEEPVYNRIEEARFTLGLSRQDLADKVGVHYQTIGYLEREEYSPSLVLALRIAKALNQEVYRAVFTNPIQERKVMMSNKKFYFLWFSPRESKFIRMKVEFGTGIRENLKRHFRQHDTFSFIRSSQEMT